MGICSARMPCAGNAICHCSMGQQNSTIKSPFLLHLRFVPNPLWNATSPPPGIGASALRIANPIANI